MEIVAVYGLGCAIGALLKNRAGKYRPFFYRNEMGKLLNWMRCLALKICFMVLSGGGSIASSSVRVPSFWGSSTSLS